MKILFAEDEEDIRELIATEIEGQLDFEIIEVSSGNEAIEYLKNNSDIDLVISDYNMPNGNGFDLYQFVKQEMPKAPFILLTSFSMAELPDFTNFAEERNNNFHIQKSMHYLDIINNLVCTLKEISKPQKTIQYHKIKISRFFQFNNVCCNIYLKLSDDKYIKVINHNDMYDENIPKKYLNKGELYFYIVTEDYPHFTKMFLKHMQNKLNKKNLSNEERIDSQLESIEFIHEQLEKFNISKEVVEMTDAVINSNIKLLKKKPKLLNILSQMMKNKDFIYEHSLMLAYIAAGIANEMAWNSEATLEKLSLAAIFHDALLPDATTTRIHDLNPDGMEKLPNSTKELINKHPIMVAEMIQKAGAAFPPDIDSILLCHHELADGSGYPRKLGHTNISPMACTLIIAEDFIREIYDQEEREVETITKNFSEKYNRGNFKKPLQGFIKLLKTI